jgi:hypothetical protein
MIPWYGWLMIAIVLALGLYSIYKEDEVNRLRNKNMETLKRIKKELTKRRVK